MKSTVRILIAFSIGVGLVWLAWTNRDVIFNQGYSP